MYTAVPTLRACVARRRSRLERARACLPRARPGGLDLAAVALVLAPVVNEARGGWPSWRGQTAGSPMRVLCLHGWRTSGAILREQMTELAAALTEAAAGELELHYPDAPHKAAGPPQDAVAAFWPGQPYYEWCGGAATSLATLLAQGIL